MEMNPYLTFEGNCAEAFEHYAKIFGGEIVFMETFRANKEMTSKMPENKLDMVMHAQLKLGNSTLMASDNPWDEPESIQGIQVQTSFDDFDEAKRVFESLAEGGKIKMPFEKTFWALGFGMLVDKFGVPWMVNCNDPANWD